MKVKKTIIVVMIITIFLGNCQEKPKASPTATPISTSPARETNEAVGVVSRENPQDHIPTTGVLISEVLPGVEGANNREFIELYNAGAEAVDLNGWTLWYLTRTGQEESLVYTWRTRADIPGQGHYLLVWAGEDFGLLPDGVYDTAVFEGKGGLILRNAEGDVVDRLGWGEAPADYFAGSPVTEFEKGNSLERLPGGELGDSQNSEDNASDFVAQSNPDPQNSGSPPAPLPEERLEISLFSPEAIPPGEKFELGVNVTNVTNRTLSNVLVSLPLADHFTAVALPEGAELVDGRVAWNIQTINPEETVSDSLILTSPFANVDTFMGGYYAEAADLPRAYGELQVLQMDGSAIPISVARSLPEGSLVTVEGMVTMYPGGFFAGSSSAKFYLEDETGGVQVFADGGRFDVSVDIGDRARVTGRTELFRDSLEVIPQDNVADIVVLESNGPEPVPTEITIVENDGDEGVLGRLNVIEGTAVRLDEFTFHYEMEMEDEAGNRTLVYMEKDTGINADPLQLGRRYQVTGISELASGVRQLKPRLQSDIVEVFPPILLLEMSGPTNILPGETMTVTITAVNYTNEPLTNVQITAVRAGQTWQIPALAGQGGRESVNYILQVPDNAAGTINVGTIMAVADQWPEPAVAPPFEMYIGQGVPIWAIQGEGGRSPLVGERVTAVGVVTGVFPEMDGFFLQSLEPDGNPTTSDGIFVSTENLGTRAHVGELLAVNGRVRENEGQTILRPAIPADIILQSEEYEGVIEPVVYDPPADPIAADVYKESLEGMFVMVNETAVVIAPTNQYGEYALVYEKWDTEMVRRSNDPVGFVIWVDDGTFNSHDDQTTLPVAVARGDTVNEVVGPLAYTFGNFKIAPTQLPDVDFAAHPLPTIPEAANDQFSIATFNVENLFDTMLPHPDSPPRPSEAEYQHRLYKVAETIVAMGGPTILALQEVENIGVLEALVAQPHLSGFNYKPVLLEGKDSRGIDVAFLIRSDRATVNGFAAHDAPNELFSRPPLVLTTTLHLESGDQQLILLNNHFLSLAAGEAQTEPVRNNQAAWNVSLVERLQMNNPEAQFVVLGDLNSFYRTKPIETLQAGGLRHAYEFFAEEENIPYTYIFEEATQTLDHILMSEVLFTDLVLVEALHTNADYPIAHPDDASPRRTSDHDPLVVIFEIGD